MFDKAVSFCGPALNYHAVAQTLNVLDYDTYFGITDTLLAGDYVSALLAYDGVLARGFSGQTFLAGLNRHLRDLMVARNPATRPRSKSQAPSPNATANRPPAARPRSSSAPCPCSPRLTDGCASPPTSACWSS